jgi:pyruvate dehydrogenase E1 component beta subunit
MARKLSFRNAINEALAHEMERDPRVILMGEDVSGGTGSPGENDAWGGPLGVTKGLSKRFPKQVLDTPISESGFIGAAIGAAASGLRPVAELMFVDFMGVCFDQIFNQAAKISLYVRRQGHDAGRRSLHDRRRISRRRPAFANSL